MIPFPNKKYKIIYADPPWKYWAGGEKNASRHYDCMEIEDIKSLPIASIADKDCALLMWATFPILQECLDVIRSWGFEYSTVAFTWVKKNPITNSYFIGCGNYTRANAEVVMLAKKGKIIRRNNGISQIIDQPIDKENHSRKPNIIRTRIVELFGDLPRIELFARTKVHGWDVWGNDTNLQSTPLEEFGLINFK